MRLLFPSIVFTIFIFSCKNDTPPTSTLPELPLQFVDTSIVIENEFCKSKDKTDCVSVDFKYLIATNGNPKVRKIINDYIEITLKKMLVTPSNNAIPKQSIPELAQHFFKNPRPQKELPTASNPLQNLGTVKVLYQDDEIVSLSLFNYYGRGLGDYYTIHKNFNKKTGQVITADNLLTDKNQLSPFFEADIRKYLQLKPTEPIGAPFSYESEDFPVNDNMGILKDSLMFTYPPYEVADYSTGGIDLFVAKSDIQHLFKK